MVCLLLAASAAAAVRPNGDDYARAWLDAAQRFISESGIPPPEPEPELEGPPASAQVGYFLRNMSVFPEQGSASVQGLPDWLDGHTIFRSVPSKWPLKMNYHYDGLASPMRFDFGKGSMTWKQAAYDSGAWEHYNKCMWFGSGSFHMGVDLCFTNPGVNILPVNGQLWLTIDNRFWGMVDAATLETPKKLGVRAFVDLATVTLNAHPACDYLGNGQCLVTYPCKGSGTGEGFELLAMMETFDTDHICVGLLKPGEGARKGLDMGVEELSRTEMPRKFIAHSHGLTLTKNFLVNKIDNFVMSKNKDKRDQGMLHYMHQNEDNLWLIHDRRTNETRILKSDFGFVNNHFANVHEDGEYIIADTLPGTANYLENYFRYNLANKSWMESRWDTIMFRPRRCYIPIAGNATIRCETLLESHPKVRDVGMDFPSYNPYYKYNKDSQWWYITTPAKSESMWFDTVAKISTKDRKIVAVYQEPGVFVMEVNFIPRPGATEEDDGLLFSVFYNSTDDTSFVSFLDPKDMTLVARHTLDTVIPYHSHGVLCLPGSGPGNTGKCFSNP